jgi:hypothetical protein
MIKINECYEIVKNGVGKCKRHLKVNTGETERQVTNLTRDDDDSVDLIIGPYEGILYRFCG